MHVNCHHFFITVCAYFLVFPPHSWDIEGAVIGGQCGEIESGSALVFEKEGRRRVCTPYIDTTSYGNLRFYFTMGTDILQGKITWKKRFNKTSFMLIEGSLCVV